MRKLCLALAGLALLLTANRAFAHHSFAAEYDDKKPVTLRGTLTKMEWVNPYGWIYLDVKDTSGKVVNWAVETGGPNALIRRGLKKTDFPAGAEIVIEGYLAKDGSSTVNANTVKFPDGRNFFAGSSGTGAPGDTAPRP
jgi:hypothetical protein